MFVKNAAKKFFDVAAYTCNIHSKFCRKWCKICMRENSLNLKFWVKMYAFNLGPRLKSSACVGLRRPAESAHSGSAMVRITDQHTASFRIWRHIHSTPPSIKQFWTLCKLMQRWKKKLKAYKRGEHIENLIMRHFIYLEFVSVLLCKRDIKS